MKRDSRLSATLHLLLHMADQPDPVTSEELARAMRTNAVVVRRLMAGLRDAGMVTSEKGHGGGWRLVRGLSAITLLDVYAALGEPRLLAIGNRTDSPDCLVEKAVNATLGDAFRDAEQTLLNRLGEVFLSDLSAELHTRLAACGGQPHPEASRAG